MRELAFAIRRLSRDRWSAIAAILVSALGAGLSTALVAVAYGVLVRPLPYADPARLAVADVSVPIGNLDLWKAQMPAFARLSGYAAPEGFTVRRLSDPEFAPFAVVDDGFFETLGAAGGVGRVFRDGDAGPVAVLSARFARKHGDSPGHLVGRTIIVGESALTVVGVMPDSFAFPSEAIDGWIPARAMPPIAFDRSPDERRLRLFGRLRPDATLAEARAELDRARAALDPKLRRAQDAVAPVEHLYDRLVGPVRPALLAFGVGAALVFLIACANVATILVGRTVSRRRELAIRGAIGASRRQLFATTIAESLLVAASGGALGAVLAWTAVRQFSSWAVGIVPRLADVRVDTPVLAVAIAGVALSTLLAALPALRAIEPAAAMLRTSGGASRRGVRVRAALAIVQIALSVVLLTAGALLARSMSALLGADTGIQDRQTLVSQLMLTDAMNFSAAGKQQWLQNVLTRIRALPGVASAGAGSSLPPANGTLVMTVRLQDNGRSTTVPEITFAAVTPGYLQAIGTHLVRGRYFNEADQRRGDLVAMLSASAARLLSPTLGPDGRNLPLSLPGMRQRGPATVVGVVSDVKYSGLTDPRGPAVYVLWKELPASQLYLAVKAAGDPRAVAGSLRRAIHDVDPGTPLMPVRTMDEVMARSVADRRLRALLGVGVAVLAFGIALVGLGGGLGRLVVERRRELAIRAALGASPARTLASVMGDGVVLVAIGVLFGTAAAYATGTLLRSFVWGISAHDPLTFVGVAGVVTLLALLACYIPARAASKANPLELLRAE